MKKSPSKWLLTLFVIAAGAFLASLYYLDPRSGIITIALFVGSLCLASFSLVSLIAYGFRRLVNRSERLGSEVSSSLREGLLVSLYVAAVLGLSGIRLLTWWDAGLLAFSLLLFEVYFSSGKEQSL